VRTGGALSGSEPAVACIVAAIGFRRCGEPELSREAVQELKKTAMPWPDARALVLHLESLTYIGTTGDALATGLDMSREANKLCPNNAGMLHAKADFLVESAIWVSPQTSGVTSEKLLAEAREAVDAAIALEPDWPKFSYTRARIRIRQARSSEEYLTALNELESAHAREATASVDSADRRARYQFEKIMVEMRWTLTGMEERVQREYRAVEKRAQEMIAEAGRRSQVQVVAAVGFLTSLLALLQFAAALFVTADKAAESAEISYWYLVITIAIVAVILMGSVALATWMIGRQSRGTSTPSPGSEPATT
jgi:ElaB/YqjD/DUF883 family membrane-anchored ribosome-binding protein